MAGEPDGCGPKLTCLATWAKARLPSKPPVEAGGGASSDDCGGMAAGALMNGAELTGEDVGPAPPAALLRHPKTKIARMQAHSAQKLLKLGRLRGKCIYRASAACVRRRSRSRTTPQETPTPTK